MINVANSSDIQVRLCAGVDVIVGCCLYISDAQRWQKVGFDQPPTARTHADISMSQQEDLLDWESLIWRVWLHELCIACYELTAY